MPQVPSRASDDSPADVPTDWPVVDVVIPAVDERASIGLVLDAIPRAFVREVVVVDNGSRDGTPEVAASHGATVIHEPRRGYGSACLAGLTALGARDRPPDVVVFLDGDYSDHPEQLPRVVGPIHRDQADLVIGSRALGGAAPGALLPQQRFGNALAAWLLRRLHGVAVTDLGPFRAVRWSTLVGLEMADRDFGWTAEMQVKAARAGARYAEVPVSYRRRIGKSKIAGTVSGTFRAGFKILTIVLRR